MSTHDEGGARRVEEPQPGSGPAPAAPPYGSAADARPASSSDTDRDHPDREDAVEERRTVKPAKTSAAAAFALALGVLALFMVLTLVLSPLGLVLGIIGIILGIIGIRAARKVGITGKGVAGTGLVFSVIAVLLAAAAAIGITTVLNNQNAVDRIQQQVQKLRDQLPTTVPRP